MAAPLPGHVGLTRRQMERELDWLLKRAPNDPKELIKLFREVMVTMLEKNNAAIMQALSEREAPAPGQGH